MNVALDTVLNRLRERAPELRSAGIRHASVFGFVARGDAGPDSDVDVLVDLDPAARIDLFDYVDLQDRLSALLGRSVDMVNRRTLKPFLRDTILSEAVDAF